MSEDAPPPVASADQAEEARRHPLVVAAAQNLHAILVGVFTLASSVISALLGYYFAHEDRQSMMQLEYDKLRAEHTLDIAKTLAVAGSHMISLSVEGSQALFFACTRDEDIGRLMTDVSKVNPLPPLTGGPTDKLRDIELHLRVSNIEAMARDQLLFQLDLIKSQQTLTDETIAARLKSFSDLSGKLMGDTTATMQIYHRDRAEEFTALAVKFLQANGDARKLLREMKCGSDAKFDEINLRIIDWNRNATTFAQSLGIAIKPD